MKTPSSYLCVCVCVRVRARAHARVRPGERERERELNTRSPRTSRSWCCRRTACARTGEAGPPLPSPEAGTRTKSARLRNCPTLGVGGSRRIPRRKRHWATKFATSLGHPVRVRALITYVMRNYILSPPSTLPRPRSHHRHPPRRLSGRQGPCAPKSELRCVGL